MENNYKNIFFIKNGFISDRDDNNRQGTIVYPSDLY